VTAQFTLEERLRYLRQYGSHCMAYSTLQPDMEYFDLPGVGYIAYMAVRSLFLGGRRILVSLADPIAAHQFQAKIVDAFLQQPSRIIFVQASERFAGVLAQFGLKINQLGIESELRLDEFDLHGKHKSQLRHWLNKARREQVKVEESSIREISTMDMVNVSGEWLRRKGGKELRLLTRPFPLASDVDVRFFSARQNGRVIAVNCFDPLYRGGRVFGYYQNHIRYRNDAPHGTSDLISVTALDRFRNEGHRTLCLGLSPCAGLGREVFTCNPTLAWALRFMFDRCNFIYPFRGNELHKRKFAGNTKPVYCASNRGTTWFDVLAVLKGIRAW
jgi:lysylphosphatidylglycerol synthetase-like protein (DUF2156 family)